MAAKVLELDRNMKKDSVRKGFLNERQINHTLKERPAQEELAQKGIASMNLNLNLNRSP